MKENNNFQNGFTLAEILGVIVIISLLLILVVPTILNKLSTSGEDAKNTENEFIYNAADLHIRENPDKYPIDKSGKYCIPIKDLIDEGKLVEPVKDVVTEEDLSDKSVLVTIYSTGTKEYEIKGAECSDLAALPMIDFIVVPTGSSWVKKRTVKIIYPSIEGDYEARFRREDKNSNKWQNDSAYNNGGEHLLTFDTSSKLTKLEAQLKGKQIISGSINVVNVDSGLPTITSISSNGVSGSNVKVNITAKDNLSGLNGIYLNTSAATPNPDSSSWIAFETNGTTSKTYSTTLSVGTYYVYVKDKAGNISESSKNKITISNATYNSPYYSCPSGYSPSISSTYQTCEKTSTTSPTYHPTSYSCSSEKKEAHYSYCNSYKQLCGYSSNSFSKSGTWCYGNWVTVTGRNENDCSTSTFLCRTSCQHYWTYCDDSKYQSNGKDCAGSTGTIVTNPTAVCRDEKAADKEDAYYSCPSGYSPSKSSTYQTCEKTSTTSPTYHEGTYTCSSGTLVGGNKCFSSQI